MFAVLVPNHSGVLGGFSFAASWRFTSLVFGSSTLTGEPLAAENRRTHVVHGLLND